MKQILEKYKTNNLVYFTGGIVLGIIFFTIIYGTKILNITYTSWIYMDLRTDLLQTQIGSLFFVHAPWEFPLGQYSTYIYPYGTSIVFTDSIPLFGLIFKLFRNILPSSFQYLGLWGLWCFAMQGGLSALILKKLNIKIEIALPVLPIFICSTALIWRLYVHTALGGQWIILLAFLVVLCIKESKLWKKIAAWAAITSLSVMIHVYFLIMIGFMLIAYLIWDFLERHKIKEDIGILLVAMLSTIFTFYLIGGFHGQGSMAASGVGFYSMNINALFDSQGFSRYLKQLNRGEGQYEGIQYLGLGAIILLILSIAYIEKHDLIKIKEKKQINIKIGIGFYIIVMTILALSPVIMLNNIVIIDYLKYVPLSIWGIFRSSGRLFWPIWYMLLFGIVLFLNKKEKMKYKLFFIFLICSIIQYIDFVPSMAFHNEGMERKMEDEQHFKEEFWDFIASKIQHIEYIGNDNNDYSRIAIFAAENNITLNRGYVARLNEELIEEHTKNVLKELKEGMIRDDTLYCMSINNWREEFIDAIQHENMEVLKIEDYIVCLKKELIEEYNISQYKFEID